MQLLKNTDNEYYFHQPPMRRSISYEGSACRIAHYFDLNKKREQIRNLSPKKTRFFISLPNILFRIKYIENNNYDLCVAFTNPELTELYYPALPNMDSFRCCTGNYTKELNQRRTSPAQIIDDFWNSIFNDELIYSHCKYFEHQPKRNPNPLANLQTWEDKTKKFPLWIPQTKNMVEFPFKNGPFSLLFEKNEERKNEIY